MARTGDGQTALVTGASAGIGVDLAECLSCLCPGPTISKFRERAGTGKTRRARAGEPMGSAEVALLGYDGWRANKRVVITGARNVILATLVPFLPRRAILGIVHNLQSPA